MQTALEILEALVREGSFRAAARRLGLTQSYLSQYVRRLEERYGTLVVDRQARPLALTEFGSVFLSNARRIEAIERETRACSADIAGLKSGSLRIASNSERISSTLAPAIAAFARLHPLFCLDLSLNLSLSEVPGALLRGQADLGILYEGSLREELDGYLLGRDRYLLALPATPRFSTLGAPFNEEGRYPLLSQCDPAPLKDLAILQQYKRQPAWLESLFAATGFAMRELPMIVRTLENRLSLVRAGLCASICQESPMAVHADSRHCRFISLEEILPVQNVLLAWVRSVYRSQAARHFCELARSLRLGAAENPAISKNG